MGSIFCQANKDYTLIAVTGPARGVCYSQALELGQSEEFECDGRVELLINRNRFFHMEEES
jgi:hypothetical protein